MDEWDKALVAFESALRQNPSSQKSLYALGRLLLDRDQFGPAVEVFQRLLTVIKTTGTILTGKREEILAEMALCWLGMEDLGKAAVFIQKAVYLTEEAEAKETETTEESTEQPEISISSSKTAHHCPTLWYALGVYHDRMGNEEAALDAYLAFIESEREIKSEISDRGREVYYRLGVIYRLSGKLKESRECFDFVRRQLSFCVRPSSTAQNQIVGPCQVEVMIQLAMLDEAEGEVRRARGTLEKLLIEVTTNSNLNPLFRCRNSIPKLRQKLGCLALSLPTVFDNDSSALALLLKATEEDPQDSLNWYYLGRLYLQLRQPTKAYDAYQQAVYRDGRNAAFWNSIGLLYFNIGQSRDALDAFTRAVHHAPHASALWWNLGLLYESCHGIGSEDAKEAFMKGADYARTKNDNLMLTKFENRLKLDGNNGDAGNPIDLTMEIDANRYVIRQSSMFPRPQSAASMSRFLTYRGQQAQAAAAAQHQQIRRISQQPGMYPPAAGAGSRIPPSGYHPPTHPSTHQVSALRPNLGTMRPPLQPAAYHHPQYRQN